LSPSRPAGLSPIRIPTKTKGNAEQGRAGFFTPSHGLGTGRYGTRGEMGVRVLLELCQIAPRGRHVVGSSGELSWTVVTGGWLGMPMTRFR
jgi:hypothetical protein